MSEISGRSKATISECVNATECEWRQIQNQAAEEERIREEARRQFIEEEKQKLRAEKQNNQTETQTSERTVNTPTEEDITRPPT